MNALRGKSTVTGFTLVELMIVVAIIGILAAIAIPNFLKYQAKSKQTEAKENLGTIYIFEMTYYGENNIFAQSRTNLNWGPTGTTRYAYTITFADTAQFSAAAAGNIDTDPTLDRWSINDQKVFTNDPNDVSS